MIFLSNLKFEFNIFVLFIICHLNCIKLPKEEKYSVFLKWNKDCRIFTWWLENEAWFQNSMPIIITDSNSPIGINFTIPSVSRIIFISLWGKLDIHPCPSRLVSLQWIVTSIAMNIVGWTVTVSRFITIWFTVLRDYSRRHVARENETNTRDICESKFINIDRW